MELSKKKKKKKPIHEKSKKLILEDLTKEELIEIIKIQNYYEEWIRKQYSEKKSLKFIYINITKKWCKLSLVKLCKLFDVVNNGYRKWVNNEKIIKGKFNEEWSKIINKAFNDNLGNYGCGKLKVVLEQEYALKLNKNTLYRYMKNSKIECQTKKWKKPKPPKEFKNKKDGFKNIIKQNFDATSPNKKWFIDESYINIKENKWVYLCAIIDSINNEIIASKISDSRDLFIALDVLIEDGNK